MESRGDAERVLAADRDEGVQVLREVRENALDAALDPVGVGTAGADDRPAAGQDAGDLSRAERLEVLLDQPPPACPDADDVVPAVDRAARNGADDRVQPGAVASPGEHSDAHVSDDIGRSAQSTGRRRRRGSQRRRSPVPPSAARQSSYVRNVPAALARATHVV